MLFQRTLFTYIMARFRYFSIIRLLIIIGLSTGCKKDRDDSLGPVIVFEAPNAGAQFFFGDAIPVKAKVTDETSIEYIRIQITNAANQIFLQSILYKDEGREKDIETSIFNSDFYLESGTYFIRITASDGTNESVAFRECQLYGAPKKLDKVYVVRQTSWNDVTIDSVNAFGLHTMNFLNVDYAGAQIDSRYQTISFLNNTENHIYHYQLPEFLLLSNFNEPATELDYFQQSKYDEQSHAMYAGTVTGKLMRMNMNGGEIVNSIQQVYNDRVVDFLVTSNYIYVLTESTIGQQRISAYYRNTAVFYQAIALDFDAVGILEFQDENHILIAGNEDGALFKIYNNQTNALNDVFQFYDQETLSGIWPGDNGDFYVYHNDGIVRYTNDMDNYSIGLNIQPTAMKYEPLTNRVFVVSENGLSILNESINLELNNYSSTEIKDVLFHYNK
jgi:hypothetical protein